MWPFKNKAPQDVSVSNYNSQLFARKYQSLLSAIEIAQEKLSHLLTDLSEQTDELSTAQIINLRQAAEQLESAHWSVRGAFPGVNNNEAS